MSGKRFELCAPKDGFVEKLLVEDGSQVNPSDKLIAFETNLEKQEKKRANAKRRLVEAFGEKLTEEYVAVQRVDLDSALAKAQKAVEIATIIFDISKISFELGEITLDVFAEDEKLLFESLEMVKVANSKLKEFELEITSQRSLYKDKIIFANSEIAFCEAKIRQMTLLSPALGTFKSLVDVNSFVKLGNKVGYVE